MITAAGLSAVLLVAIVGGFMLNRPTTTPVATAEGAGDVPLAEFESSVSDASESSNVVVFMRADATEDELSAVADVLDESITVSSYFFMSKEEIYEEFEEFFVDDPELLDTISVDTMPPSFRLVVDDLDDPILDQLGDLSGVRDVMLPTDSFSLVPPTPPADANSTTTTSIANTTTSVVDDELTQAVFTSPSGNISCVMNQWVGASCWIGEKEWTVAESSEPNCEYDFGNVVDFSTESGVEYPCYSDTIWHSGARPLAYGDSVTVGDLTCTSSREGMTCVNEDGRGFRLSRAAVDEF